MKGWGKMDCGLMVIKMKNPCYGVARFFLCGFYNKVKCGGLVVHA